MERGIVYDQVLSALGSEKFFRDFQSRRIGLDEYKAALHDFETKVDNPPLNVDKRRLTLRWPLDEKSFIERTYHDLVDQGHIPPCDFDYDGFQSVRRQVKATFEHRDRQTYIYPEEEVVAYLIAYALRPRNIVCVGSYYGYWAVWFALGASRSVDCRLVLIDPDPDVIALSQENFARFGLEERTTFFRGTAEDFFSQNETLFDLIVLDAEGDEDDQRPDHRGKAIYGPLSAALTPALAPEARLVTHNILVSDAADDDYITRRAAENRSLLSAFFKVTRGTFRHERLIQTTEGISVHSGVSTAKEVRMPDIKIVKPTREDVDDIYKLMRELAEFEGYWDDMKVDPEYVIQHALGDDPQFFMLVAKNEQNAVTGLAVYFFIEFTYHARPVLFMKELIVDRQYRHAGVGKALMDGLVDIAKTNGCPEIKWSVAAWNDSGRRFYRSIGANEAPDWIPCSLKVG